MPLPSAMLLHPEYTDRPVDARWQRVTDLAARGEPADGPYDDAWVREGLDYLLQLQNCRGGVERDVLRRISPAVDVAHRLHTSPDRLQRGGVEARLLLGQTAQEVAAACGLTPAAVDAYLQLYFDVAGKLHAHNYILIHAVGGDLWGGRLAEADVDVLLKLYAYSIGPALLPVMERYFRGDWSIPTRLDQASIAELKDLAQMLWVKALVLSRVLPFRERSRAFRARRLARELEDHVASLTGKCQGMAVLMGSILAEDACATPPAGTSSSPEPPVARLLPGTDPEDWWVAWRTAVLAA
jgi:hypothetical protein